MSKEEEGTPPPPSVPFVLLVNGAHNHLPGVQCDICWRNAVSLVAYTVHLLQQSVETAINAKYVQLLANEKLNCPKCRWVLDEAVTLQCGHTMCRRCCLPITSAQDVQRKTIAFSCFKCGERHEQRQPQLKTNVMVVGIVEKWWKQELEAVEWRKKGDDAYFGSKNFDFALELYDKSIDAGNLPSFYYLGRNDDIIILFK